MPVLGCVGRLDGILVARRDGTFSVASLPWFQGWDLFGTDSGFETSPYPVGLVFFSISAGASALKSRTRAFHASKICAGMCSDKDSENKLASVLVRDLGIFVTTT
jgi:hypothetical protein